MTTGGELLDWMLDSDPALRWQGERDLAFAPPEVWQATRARVATTWALNSLREWGMPAEALGDTAARLAANAT